MAEYEVPAMTDYERRRLENVKRNAKMLSSLNINSIVSELSNKSSFKRTRPYKKKQTKKNYERSRSSLRSKGIPPSEPFGIPYNITPSISRTELKAMAPSSIKGKISMRNVCQDAEVSHQSFMKKLKSLKKSEINFGRMKLKEPVNIGTFMLKSENVAQIVPNELSVIRFLPTKNVTMVVAGSRFGHLGFWNVSSRDVNEGSKAVHLYQPNSATVYGISVHPFSLTKMYSCCYDGLLRLMNIETEKFHVVYSSNSKSSIYSLSQPPDDANSVYIGEGKGEFNLYDGRVGKITSSWLLHKGRINSIDFHPENTNVIATSSFDGFACLWDLRKMSPRNSECNAFRVFHYEDRKKQPRQSLQSAYFSPSGSSLAITRLGHSIAVLSGSNFEDAQIVHRDYTLYPRSRAIWGWDDTYLYTGCNQRRVDILSVPQQKMVHRLESSFVSSIPLQFDAHPYTVGMLAGASYQGKGFVWTAI